MSSSQRTSSDRLTTGVKVAVAFAAIFCAAVFGYLTGVRQTSPGANAAAGRKTYEIKLGQIDLHLTVGAMGVAVILILTILLAIAVFLTIVAQRRRKQAEAAQGEVNKLNADLERRVAERTEQLREAYRTMEYRNTELIALNQELESFSYSVSHDLRAPLRAIDGFSNALMEDYEDKLEAAGKVDLQRIRAATVRMGQLIDGMLTLARTARCEMRREQVDLSGMAVEIISQLQRSEPERHVISVVAPNLIVTGDRVLLQTTMQNLLGNAWKFTSKRPDARIELGTQEQDGRRLCFVRDNGAGFDMKYVDKLFGTFQRLHDARDFPGTGIGLAIVQRIVNRHGGRVWAESEVGKGTTFYFDLWAPDTVASVPEESPAVSSYSHR